MRIINFTCIAAAAAFMLMAAEGASARVAESKVKATITSEPRNIPSARMTDAPLMGNGDIGVSLGGNASHLTFYVGKNDFWRAMERYPGGIEFPGAIELKLQGMEGASYRVEQLPFCAELKGEFKAKGTTLRLRSWVAAQDNCIVIELEANRNLQGEISLNLPVESYSRTESGLWTASDDAAGIAASAASNKAGAAGSKGTGSKGAGILWATRSFDDASVLWPTHVAFALDGEGGSFRLRKGQKKTFAIWVYTNHDAEAIEKQAALAQATKQASAALAQDTKQASAALAQQAGKSFLQLAIDGAAATDARRIAELRARHDEWWKGFWSESEVDFDDPMLLKYYYQSLYILAMSTRSGKMAPGIWGPFATRDDMMWGGDYHLNYNYQSPYWALCGANHVSLTDNFMEPILAYMDAGFWHAQDLLGIGGIYYPVGIGPKGLCTTRWPDNEEEMMRRYASRELDIDHGYKFLGQKINAVFSVPNIMMRHYSTLDRAFAEETYPYLLACADFWEDYLKWDGERYVIEMDHYGEVYPNKRNNGDWRKYLGDFNSTLSLGLVKGLFMGIIDMSRFLGKDADRIQKWEYILAHLSEIPTGVNADGRVSLKNMERGPGNSVPAARGLSRVSIHALVVPNGICGPVSTPEFNRMLLADVNDWGRRRGEGSDWANSMGNGIETDYPAAARVGYDPAKLLSHLKERIEMAHYDNAVIIQTGGGLEAFTAVPMTIDEMLCQSYEGTLRVFPNWDMSKDASFSNIRAYGAFLVSSAVKGGKVGSVRIISEKGGTLRLENPWKSGSVIINGTNYTGEVFSIETTPGQEILVRR